MGYREEILKTIRELREYKQARENDIENAMQFKKILPLQEKCLQAKFFFIGLKNHPADYFGSKDAYRAFVAKYPDLCPDGQVPSIGEIGEYGDPNFSDVDYEKFFDALDEELKERSGVLEKLFKDSDPKMRAVNHPLSEIIENIKKDAQKFGEDGPALQATLDALDYANEDIVEKTGKNVVDGAVDRNANVRSVIAFREFGQFVEKENLDSTKVVNRSLRKATISAGFNKPERFADYKPFLKMESSYPQEYKQKLLALDALLKEEGLLTNAQGGESGNKEYGLMDYFQRNYALNKAIIDYQNLTNDDEKKAAIANIQKLSDEMKEVSGKYEKVYDFIEKNFDLDHISLPGNIYSGRPSSVPDGDLTKWRPNLPPKFDFEKTPAVVFLNGFTQLKASCQLGEVPLEEYLEHPGKTYLSGAKKLGQEEDKIFYLPRSEQNTLGKRMAHAFYGSTKAYGVLSGYNMSGGRGMEFLYNTSPDKENQSGNIIKSSIIKEYSAMYNHDPVMLFSTAVDANCQGLKNLFLAGDKVDDFYKLSKNYVNEEGDFDCAIKDYSASLKKRGNVSVEDEYRRIMTTLRDFSDERIEMAEHYDQYLRGPNDMMNTSISEGALIGAGRQYFVDYMKENNLSLASVEDPALREEITNFMIDPVATFAKKHNVFGDNAPESLETVKSEYRLFWKNGPKKESESFFEKFAEHNNKPHGYNVGKPISKILSDNKGGWYERFRGTTSKEYTALQKIAKASIDPNSPINGDKEALYTAAKAYKAYKLPEGARFERLSKTAKKRIEFCDSIIETYEAEKRAKELANNPQPVLQNNNNNIIQSQDDFQNQLAVDMAPKETKVIEVEEDNAPAFEKDPPDNAGL